MQWSYYYFLNVSFKPALSLSFTLIKSLFSSSSLSGIRVVSSVYLWLLMFLPPILFPACNSSSLAFLMICSAYRLNKRSDSRQPWRTPFSILNRSFLSYRVLTVASWPAYRFLRRQVRWSGIPISLRAFHSLLWSTQSRLWLSQWNRGRCFFSGIPWLSLWSSKGWHFDLWFLILF